MDTSSDKSYYLWGLILTACVILLFHLQPDFIESADNKTFDLLTRVRSNPNPGDEIVIVHIDKESIEKIGRWPWPRTFIAQALKTIASGAPRVVALNILFSEPDESAGLKELRRVRETFRDLNFPGLESGSEALLPPGSPPAVSPYELYRKTDTFLSFLDDAEDRLDTDSTLHESIERTGNVILPLFFELGPVIGSTGEDDLPEFLQRCPLTTITAPENDFLYSLITANEITCPLPHFAEAATGMGHVNLDPLSDGTIRWEPLVVEYENLLFPSFSLQIAARYFNLPADAIEVVLGEGIRFGPIAIPTDHQMRMLISFNGPNRTFPYYSFYDVLNEKLSPGVFRDKIVLIGVTASGIFDSLVTPVSPNFPGVELTANVVENILHQNFVFQPYWARLFEFGMVLFFGLFAIFVLPRLKARSASLLSLFLLLSLFTFVAAMFIANGMWISMVYPTVLLLLAYIFITSRQFLATERAKERVEADSVETNKMLGLSFQGQGMLDLAFDKLRKCPVDDVMKDILYNLALDFERKRQFNKAAAVYEHIQRFDPTFKDVRDRRMKMRTAAESMAFGLSGNKGTGTQDTVMVDVEAAHPTLGRYEILGEIGKGAMGIVYKGRDPKINRIVALKTIRFNQEFEEDQLKEAKERFFREAEAAGNLSHPNIVTIYDAGEDYEVSYMAMEFLEGADLKRFCNGGHRLPFRNTLLICARVCDALEYAHRNGIVHRDIKPGNILLEKSGAVKVTDFGIARITSSSKTRTGTILGTPGYMSPEQIMGKKVDGRSDLFSLGVVLFELLTGDRPFHGETIATLMYQIANEPHPSPRLFNAEIPDACETFINKVLEKTVEDRYQNASLMATDLRNIVREL